MLLQIILASAAGAANKIMPLGDSITRGETSGVPDEAFQVSYRNALFEKLEAAGYVINDEIFVGTLFSGESVPDFDPDHDGHSGWQADEIVDGNPGFPAAGKLEEWLDAEKPNIVLLHIGTNDISNNNQDWTEVDDILDVIDNYENKPSGNAVWVILSLIIDRSCSLDTPPCQDSLDTTAFNSNVETLVFDPRQGSGDKIVLVDMQNSTGIDYRLSTIGGDMWDDIHPFETGYDKMADLWYTRLMEILPQADAGPDQDANEFDIVTLDASGSNDPKNGTLTYQWVQTAGTPVVLSDDTAVQPTFDAPDAGLNGKTLTFTLTVTDEDELVSTDEVDVVVAKIIPQANAGPDQTVNESVTVTLDASNSVGVGLAYQWMQTAGTTVTLTGAATSTATFTAPNVGSNGETLSFRLTITDDDSLEDTDTVNITVRNPNSSGGGGGGGGGGGCFIATATISSPMTLSGKAPHEPYSQTTMVIWQRLMAGNITLLTPSAGHIATQALVVSMVMLLSFGVANTLRKPRKRWRKL